MIKRNKLDLGNTLHIDQDHTKKLNSANSYEIHLIDYGLSTFWIDCNREHIPNVEHETITGTPKYVSYNNHIGNTLSRRDDLISLGYMMMYFMYGYLPWQGKTIYRETKSLAGIIEFLDNETPIYEDLPSIKMHYYMEYCYSLEFEETPNYNILIDLFTC